MLQSWAKRTRKFLPLVVKFLGNWDERAGESVLLGNLRGVYLLLGRSEKKSVLLKSRQTTGHGAYEVLRSLDSGFQRHVQVALRTDGGEACPFPSNSRCVTWELSGVGRTSSMSPGSS